MMTPGEMAFLRQLMERVNRLEKRLVVQETVEQVATITDEYIADTVGAMVSGNTETGITVTYQDSDNTIDFALSDEYLQDVVGALITDSSSIDVTYTDGSNTLSIAIIDEYVADLVGTMVTGNTETGVSVTYQDSDNTIDFVVGVDNSTVEISGGNIQEKDDGTTNAKLANMAQSTIKGRAAGAGTGDPTDLTATQAAAIVQALIDHGSIAGLSDDDHTGYALLAGRSGGQTLKGGTASGDDLTLMSTNNATKGNLFFGTSTYDEVNNFLGVKNTDPVGELEVVATSTANAVRGITSTQINSGAQGALFNFRKARGSRGSESTVADADFGFVQNAWFHDGTNYLNLGRIAAKVNGAVSAGNIPVDLIFSVGVTALAEALRILSSGVTVTGGLTSAGASQLGVKAGTSTNDAAVGGVLYVDSGTYANGTTVETDLATYTVPANTLSANNMSLVFEAWGTFAANGNAKTVKLKFGSDSFTTHTTSGTGTWYIRGHIIRTGAATQDVFVQGGTTTVGTATRTLSSSDVLKVTGQGGATNDVVQEGFKVYFEDANT